MSTVDRSTLDARLAGLSPERRELALQRLRAQEQASSTFPLSLMQRRLWFLEELAPGNRAYVLPAAVRLRGDLSPRRLGAAVDAVVRRHESLRTVFRNALGGPVQIVLPARPLDLPVEPRDEGAPEHEQIARIVDRLSRPFDLASGPLLRVELLRTSSTEHVLVIVMHHLVSDGWSLGILVSEVVRLYAAGGGSAADSGDPLPELPIQYGDYAVWQESLLAGGGLEPQLAYWRNNLAGAPAVLSLPTDRARPALQGWHGASVPLALSADVMSRLQTVARADRATVFMALLAAFEIVLQRYSQQDDIVVGIPVANRERSEVETLIGFFVNSVAIRVDHGADPSFRELLRRVLDACVGAYANQSAPFERIVEDLHVPRDLSRPPVFQVSFSYQNEPLPDMEFAGIEVSRIALESQTARYDLEIQLFGKGGGAAGWLEYDSDLFDRPTIERLARHLSRVVELVTAHPDAPLARLPLADANEETELLALGCGPEREWPDGWIHEAFELRAALTPDAAAVRFEGVSVSYAELDRRTNVLARALRSRGVGRDVLVGVCMQRSVEMVVSLLAVVKAGGAYLPLDPGLPPARLQLMLEDAQPQLILCQEPLRDLIPATDPAIDVCLPADLEAGSSPADALTLGIEVGGDDLAYVIYTSGSTGTPKGVMNTHAGIRNRLLWMQDAFTLGAADRILQKTPFAFDVSVWEFFWPLLAGACLVVARPEGHKDPAYLAQVVQAERVTVIHFVPSMLRSFLAEPAAARCGGLRHVICSGEELTTELQERFFEVLTCPLHNLYGPTEAAVDVTAWTCSADGDQRAVPIGFPIANTQVHLLDPQGRPVPLGVPGELYLGGVNVARGYLGRPELTAERFVADPFSRRPGARLYRTGDLGRRRVDGATEFLGRLDHQVKLRGFRIELGEIEAVALSHPLVNEAVVLTRPAPSGDPLLVAFVAGAPDLAPTELTALLRLHLPDYMVPARIAVLDALPLTPSGKVDRRALAEIALAERDPTTVFVAPGDDVERAIALTWSEVLGVDRVGVDDNFFDLGGHSLLLSELRRALNERLRTDLTMVELFQHPSVRSLARHVVGGEPTSPDPVRSATHRADQRRRAAAHRTRTTELRRNTVREDG